MNLLHNDSPAGRAIELVNDLVKQGRMSQAEARVIEDLVWNPEFPERLRRTMVAPRLNLDLDAVAGVDPSTGATFTLRDMGFRDDGSFDERAQWGFRTRPKDWSTNLPEADGEVRINGVVKVKVTDGQSSEPLVPRRPIDAAQ